MGVNELLKDLRKGLSHRKSMISCFVLHTKQASFLGSAERVPASFAKIGTSSILPGSGLTREVALAISVDVSAT
jgi:hypothetical protein